MNPARRWTIVLVLLLVVAALLLAWRRSCSSSGSSIRVTISKDTTYITEPLRADGYPDYVAALNQRFSEGVTPENNSAVLFWKAIGPRELGGKYREKHFKMLGIPPLPGTGDYFIEDWMEREVKAEENLEWRYQLKKQYDSAIERPWSKQEFPVWAEWLSANEKPLAMLAEAFKRSRRYDPLIADEDGTVISILLPGVQASRDVAGALIARAMLRLHQGKTDEAWADLLACHRLARLVGQGPFLVEAMAAITIEGMACTADQTLLQDTKLTASQIAKMRANLAKLPPMSKMADKLDVAERFIFLDCMSFVAREGPLAMGDFEMGTRMPDNAIRSIGNLIGSAVIDWDLILRMGNKWYDRIAVACREPTWAARKKAMDSIEHDIKTLGSASSRLSMLFNPSRTIGHVYMRLLLPAVSRCVVVEDRATMQFELTKLAFALAAYHADRGSYPAKLAELTPKYVPAVPKDIFNEADLHYRRADKGYLLYSVGENGVDDGGNGREDAEQAKGFENWDDQVIRMPQ